MLMYEDGVAGKYRSALLTAEADALEVEIVFKISDGPRLEMTVTQVRKLIEKLDLACKAVAR